MQIKWKAITAVMLLICGICTVYLLFFLKHIRGDLRESIALYTRSVTSLAEFIDQNNRKRFSSRIKNFVNTRISPAREQLIVAFKNRDRDLLLRKSRPFFRVFKKECSYFASMAWILPDNTAFLRVHKPELYGDNLGEMRVDIAEVNRSHRPLAGYAVGFLGLQLRVVQPVFYKGEYIGALQFGIDAQETLDAIEKELDTHSGLLITSHYFRFITQPALLAAEFQHCSVQTDTPELFSAAGESICNKTREQEIGWRDRHFIVRKVLGLKDYRGRNISEIVVALDITQMHQAVSKAVTWALVIAFGVLLVSAVILEFSFEKILSEVVRLNTSLSKEKESLARRVEERTQELAQKVAEYEVVAHAVENAIDAFVFVDLDGKITYPNRACCTLFGYEASQIIGQHINILRAIEEREHSSQIIHCLREKGRWTGHITGRKQNGENFKCLLSASMIYDSNKNPVGMLGILRDLSEIEKIEEQKAAIEAQLQQATKLESIGRLAGGVAHDFNNILNVINGYAELGLLDVSPEDPLHDKLKGIIAAGKRASDLTQQLLAFSRKQIIRREAVDFHSLITDMESMIRRILGEDIEVSVRTSSDLWHAMADRSQLEQIIMNLAVNARDAMPSGGRLSIEASNVVVDEEYSRMHYNIPTGRYVSIKISDTGEGMDSKVRERIFEPFFTTKEQGKGTGLGLATVYGIVKQNGGAIMVYSEPGQGTTFKIVLPAADMTEETSSEAEADVSTQPAGGNETILLVEDDMAVRTLTATILHKLGYSVIEAESPEEALSMFDRIRHRVDMLLTDVVMPGMNGPEMAEKLLKMEPGLKVLFMSGYTEDVIVDKGILKEGINLLHKPFTLKSVAEAVKKTLED